MAVRLAITGSKRERALTERDTGRQTVKQRQGELRYSETTETHRDTE